MLLKFRVAIYIEGKLFSQKNFRDDRLFFKCWLIVVQDQVPIRFKGGIREKSTSHLPSFENIFTSLCKTATRRDCYKRQQWSAYLVILTFNFYI